MTHNIEMNRDTIKMIAMLTMLMNHTACVFMEHGTPVWIIFTDIGYFTAITMCYFLVEGYQYTHSKKQYGIRLLSAAVISQLPYHMVFSEGGQWNSVNLNMMFTLFLCFLIICSVKALPREKAAGAVFILSFLTMFCDWAVFAAVFTLLFLWAGDSAEKKKKAFLWAAASFGISIFLDNLSMQGQAGQPPGILYSLGLALAAATGPALSGLCILCCYNGKRIQKNKKFFQWFFYLFYPAHLMILGMLRVLEMY